MSGNGPKDVEKRLTNLLNAWKNEAPNATFGGMTLDQFKNKVKPSLDARQRVADLEAQLTGAQDVRDDADKVTSPLIQLVVNAIKGDPNYGEDSALYEEAGYIRKSERSSGKTNKAAAAKAVPTA